MRENLEYPEEVIWAKKFLENHINDFKDNGSRATFRRMLDTNNIQENEADEFLKAYQEGKTEKFLENRVPKEEAPQFPPLPEEEQETIKYPEKKGKETQPPHKQAA